jgi:hypothetical protein
LLKEAQYFLNKIYYLSIPDYNDRLIIPALSSIEKGRMEDITVNPLDEFVRDYCVTGKDYEELFSDVYLKFINVMGSNMSKIGFGKSLPLQFTKMKRKKDNQTVIRGLKLK